MFEPCHPEGDQGNDRPKERRSSAKRRLVFYQDAQKDDFSFLREGPAAVSCLCIRISSNVLIKVGVAELVLDLPDYSPADCSDQKEVLSKTEGCEGILIHWPLREPRSSQKEAEESAESLSTSPQGKKMKPH